MVLGHLTLSFVVGGCNTKGEATCFAIHGYSLSLKGNSMNVLGLIFKIIAGLSPEVRAELSAALDKAQAAANKTKLPFDDIAIAIIRFGTGL